MKFEASYLVLGTALRTGGMYAQCRAYLAPPAIHRRTVSISATVNDLPDLTGGMRTDSSVAVIRSIKALSPGLPGTIAVDSMRESATSRRSLALRRFSSGP